MKDDMRLLGQEASKVENRTQMPIQWGNNIPVSYTHLDVYKRQVLKIDNKPFVITLATATSVCGTSAAIAVGAARCV